MTVHDVLSAAAAVPFAMAIVVFAVGMLRVPGARRAGPAELAAALGLGLEFLLAAGLLRLASLDDFAALAAVAAIVAVRRLLTRGLSYSLTALGVAQRRRLHA